MCRRGRDVSLVRLLCLLLLATSAASHKKKKKKKEGFDMASAGGKMAKEGEFPYAAFITVPNGNCTGVILDRRWIVTAAHCVGNNTLPGHIQVLIGTTKWNNTKEKWSKALDVFTHPKYEKSLLHGDLALIRVPPMRFGDYVNAVQVHNESWDGTPKDCVTMAFGKLWHDGPEVEGLSTADVKAQRGSRGCSCLRRKQRLFGVCLSRKSFKRSCMWDTGGPLVCDNRLVGIAHGGIDKVSCIYFNPRTKTKCKPEKTFEIFTFLCPHLNWMREHVPSLPFQPKTCQGTLLSPLLPLFSLLSLFVIY